MNILNRKKAVAMDTFRLCANINLDAFWHNISEIRRNISSYDDNGCD